jgi:hypothetical protein
VPEENFCTILRGDSTCDINFSWTTNIPPGHTAISEITTNVPTPNTTVATGNNGGSTSFSVKWSGQNFYLYNSEQSLVPTVESPNGSGVHVSAVCEAGTVWYYATNVCDVVILPLSVDLKVDSGDYPTSETAHEVLLGQIVDFSWVATGGGTLSCTLEDGTAGWSGTASPATSGTKNITSPNTLGLNKYTIRCTDASGTVVDAVWVNVKIIVPVPPACPDCPDGPSNPPSVQPGGSIVVSWKCPATSTASVSPNFDTGGAPSGSVTLTPDVTTTYSITCNDPSNTQDSTTITVKKTPFFIDN